jgi:hypothetical protein
MGFRAFTMISLWQFALPDFGGLPTTFQIELAGYFSDKLLIG